MNQRRFAQKVFTLMKLNHLPSWECRLYVHILSQMYSTPVLMARQFLKCRIESKKKQPAPKKNFYSSRIIPAEWLASDLRASMKIQMTQLNLQCSRLIFTSKLTRKIDSSSLISKRKLMSLKFPIVSLRVLILASRRCNSKKNSESTKLSMRAGRCHTWLVTKMMSSLQRSDINWKRKKRNKH